MRLHATIAIALVRPHHSVEAVDIHHQTATTAAAPLPRVATAPVAKTTVVVAHPVMITTPATAATVLRLHLAPPGPPSTILMRQLVAATAMITALPHAADTRIRTPLMGTTDLLGLERLRGHMAGTMSVLRRQDTGDCSSSSFCVKAPLMERAAAYHDRTPSNRLLLSFRHKTKRMTLSADGGCL